MEGIDINFQCITFFFDIIDTEEITGKKVLEIKSKHNDWSLRPDHNWSFKSIIKNHFKPKEYYGIDDSSGKYVDVILSVYNIIEIFGFEYFDIVLANEILHNTLDWNKAINNIKCVLKEGGLLYLTAKSRGAKPLIGDFSHRKPIDYWRFEIEDIKELFSDFEIILLKDKPYKADPGVIFIGRKPINYKENSLREEFAPYSMIFRKRIKTLEHSKIQNQLVKKEVLEYLLKKFFNFFKKLKKYLERKLDINF